MSTVSHSTAAVDFQKIDNCLTSFLEESHLRTLPCVSRKISHGIPVSEILSDSNVWRARAVREFGDSAIRVKHRLNSWKQAYEASTRIHDPHTTRAEKDQRLHDTFQRYFDSSVSLCSTFAKYLTLEGSKELRAFED